MGTIWCLYMGNGANYTLLTNSCSLTLLHTIMSGMVMTARMTCLALLIPNGTVFTCKTGGGQMNQTIIWFESCPTSSPSSAKQPGNDSVLHTVVGPTLAVVVIIVVITVTCFIVLWCVRRTKQQDTSPPTQQDTSPPTQQDTTPPTQQDTSPPTQQDTSPPTQQDTSPPTQQGTSPPTQQDTTTGAQEDITPGNCQSAITEMGGLGKAEMVHMAGGAIGRSQPGTSSKRDIKPINMGKSSDMHTEKKHFPATMGSCQEPTTQGTSSPEYAHPKPHLTKTLPFVGIGITSIEPEGLRKESCVAVSH
eukprot:Em0019g936a